jgi:hypothetical protein
MRELLYQPILDRYIAGDDVPVADVQQVWRNATQPPSSFSIIYQELLPAVRRINEQLRPEKQLRVLALDPPIDWSKVRSTEDLEPFIDPDLTVASVMEKEVFEKRRKALMIIGILHVIHQYGGAAAIYEQRYPNTTYIVAPHWGFGNEVPSSAQINDELERRMTSWPIPSLIAMDRTWLAEIPSEYFTPRLDDAPAGSRGFIGVDGSAPSIIASADTCKEHLGRGLYGGARTAC